MNTFLEILTLGPILEFSKIIRLFPILTFDFKIALGSTSGLLSIFKSFLKYLYFEL